MLERLSWKRLALELFLACIPALILGAFVGHLPWFLLAAVTGLLIWHFWNLMRLSWWLWVDRSMTPPPGRGSWEPLLYGLLVAVGGPEHDSSAWPRQLGAAAVWSAPDADA